MNNIEIGDVFEILTSNGIAYLQYVYKDPKRNELIRVLPGLCEVQPIELNHLVNKPELFVLFFPIGAAKGKKIIKKVGNFQVPTRFEIPQYFISEQIINGKLLGWHLHDLKSWQMHFLKNLSEIQKKYSPWSTWNDTYLIERLSEKWTPEKEIVTLINKYGAP